MDCPLLAAMIRRLEGGVRIPKFGDKLEKKFSRKDKLIAKVRKLFNEELCGVSADEKLPIKLAKLMSVAVLGLKMKLYNPEIFFPEFCSVSAYIKRWLIDYLFECNKIPEIPYSVEKTINIINYMYQKQYKQNMLDKTFDYNMDEDYNDTYLKDVEGNSYVALLKDGSNHSDESNGECETNGFVLPELASDKISSDGAGHAQKSVNKYLAIQEICGEKILNLMEIDTNYPIIKNLC
ncbi:hypothetical protein MKX01_031592 [Papaver californicum]|nr:hypothetical protein MKX01_031592 [Papaver californicum]